MQRLIRSIEELEVFAVNWLNRLVMEKEHATLVFLRGELGAGKTAFAKAVAKTLGINDLVQSPTFVLMRQYSIANQSPYTKLVHIDAYRLQQVADLAALRFDELYRNPHNLILFEWPEMIEPHHYSPTETLTFSVNEHEERVISST